ncbi:hypothetical protein ACJA29_02405 [Metamycoplasma sualvi]
MKTLELANIINFINDIREEKTFLIKGFFSLISLILLMILEKKKLF